MSDKELETNDGVPIVNSWDQPGGESGNKVLIKTMSGQTGTTSVVTEPIVKEESPVIADVPFVAPAISFDIPKSEPIEIEAKPIAQPVQPVQPAQPIQPVQPVQPVQPIQPVQPVQPVQPIQPIQPIETPTEPIIKTFNEVTPIEGYSVAAPENENVLPAFDMPSSIVTEKQPNPQQDILNKVKVEDIPTVIKEAPMAEENQKIDIQTMSAQELNKNFSSVINKEPDPLQDVVRKQGETMQIDSLPVSGEMVEAYKEQSDNTFSNIFTDQPVSEQTFFSQEEKVNLEAQPGIPKAEERAELKRPDTNANYRKTKKRLFPQGWGMGIVIFIFVLIFVMSIDQISLFFDNIFSN